MTVYTPWRGRGGEPFTEWVGWPGQRFNWWTRLLYGPVLSIEQFAEFYTMMPTFCEWERNPRHASGGLEHWAREYPQLARRSPARQILAQMREELAWREREQEPASSFCEPEA
jgi:hypothetical protein